MLAAVVEGDSLAAAMRPALTESLRIRAYDAEPGRLADVGVTRLLARHDLAGRPVIVSLGTADHMLGSAATAVSIAHDARRLLREADCVVWAAIRVEREAWGDTGDQAAALNRGLRRVTRLHVVKPVRPDAGDGIHYTPVAAQAMAGRVAHVVRHECRGGVGPTRHGRP